MKLSKKDWLHIPVVSLLAANRISVCGVLFLGWYYIFLLHWTENIVIGFYNVLKMIFAAVPHPSHTWASCFSFYSSLFTMVASQPFTAFSCRHCFTKVKALPWAERISHAF